MQYLEKHSIYISNTKNSLDFYINKLGMKLVNQFLEDEKEFYQLKFNLDTNEAILELIRDKNNTQIVYPKDDNRLTGYWKMAISIKDVDIARQKLIEKGIEVTEAFQVPNVANLCHFFDPDGYGLEFIQHEFEQNHKKQKEDSNYVLGNRAIFSLITYRIKDIEKSLNFYEKDLNMKLLSKMNLEKRGFDLYFLGFTKEKLPNEDVEDIENRQWLWKRDFTMIELQYVFDLDENFKYETGISTGFKSLTVFSNEEKTLIDPDGYKIEVKSI
ncbi:VOC family protein [Arcobacter sp. LA11]|uniref:VOC family protein n=1 Tax=Arcobacter sp. LA11 TaxID=1898176 RepID=UPI0009333468|nr:VOC family protein [Arcobacter sp. LA11]